ncbi:T9SS type B sorting domain-containing protein [Flavobacterium sp. GSP27]|uniref:T9SS type B sorting domain-containing protein n=1 Tax=Flavobacterium sp. GSP27 TaxID=2497489 RepID=UPI000F841C53|nr:T9SS type B sorting domain-containing protein [Flavobacterium sp. GSP27]RTZ08839.1 T9SS type B sorting domain-containing protein [Flavobacterium sp. GSP27]
MKTTVFFKIILALSLFITKTAYAIDPPVIKATGNQIYCPGTSLNIVKTINISFDPDEPTTDAVTIQISSGYTAGDLLTLTGSHPSVSYNWIVSEGMLKLSSTTGGKIPYADFEAAIKDIKFYNNNTSPSGNRTFSISLGTGQLSYLPSNGHYYEYVASSGINWTRARNEAAVKRYYGLQGYLATLTVADEAQLAGAQAPGTGWIGGSDAETEGTWKWVTGPEAGTTFWMGKNNGTTTAPFYYANWNSPNEPNDSRNNEDYAHITSSAVGNPGTWNDLPEQGDPPGNYYPNGYIVEYGGMPDDPILQISASTTITTSQISGTTPAWRCGSGTVTLQAIATAGTVNWYDTASNGNLLHTGNAYTTPFLDTTTTYYVAAECPTNRTAVTATINTIPTITSTNTPVTRCGAGPTTLKATTNTPDSTVNWYLAQTGGSLVTTGMQFTTTVSENTTYYAEAINNGCSNGRRIAVEIMIYDPPIVMDEELILCESGSLTLDAQIPDLKYLWSTGETTKTIVVTTPGVYSVDITNNANCSSTKKITVIAHDAPDIDRIDVNETTVVIYLKNPKDYFEYSVDGIDYQSSNVFFNVASGLQTAYVREVNSCGTDRKAFIVLITPKFFTPNNDSHNDVWEIKGLVNYPEAEVTIFDRYGKLITKLNSTKPSWDGTFNKNLLPADDYWYVLKIDANSPEKRGHFSLKR